MQRVAVLGAGNAGHAAAAHLVQMGLDVTLYNRWQREIDSLEAQGGVTLKGVLGEGFYPVSCITTDLSEAMEGADLFWVATPAVAHEYLAMHMASLLPAGARVFLNPGSSGGALAFANSVVRHGGPSDLVVAETNTSIYICRITAPSTVTVWNLASEAIFSAFPGSQGRAFHDLLSRYLPNLVLYPTVLDTTFANVNAIMHPAGVLLNSGWIEHTGGGFKFYTEGSTPAVGSIIDQLDRERMAAMAALGLKPRAFVDIFYRYGATTEAALKSGSSGMAMRQSEPNRLIAAPPDLKHRYISEDVPFGLVPIRHLAALGGVKTPVIDALILLASVINNTDYLSSGLTLEKMGLSGLQPYSLQAYLHEGLTANEGD